MSFEEKQKALLRAEIFAGLLFEEQFIEMIFREAENMLDLEQSAVAPYIEKIKTLDEYALGMILDKIFEIDSLSGWRNTCKGYLRKIRGVLPTTPDQNRIGCENGGGSSKKEPAHRPVQWFSSSGG